MTSEIGAIIGNCFSTQRACGGGKPDPRRSSRGFCGCGRGDFMLWSGVYVMEWERRVGIGVDIGGEIIQLGPVGVVGGGGKVEEHCIHGVGGVVKGF